MNYVVGFYFSAFAPYGCWKEVKAAAGILTVPDGEDSGVVDNDGLLTLKKKVRCRGWTEIVEGHASTARGLVDCEPCVDENWLYRQSASETAGARYQEWLGWYLGDKVCVLFKEACQFWWRGAVEGGWTSAIKEVTV